MIAASRACGAFADRVWPGPWQGGQSGVADRCAVCHPATEAVALEVHGRHICHLTAPIRRWPRCPADVRSAMEKSMAATTAHWTTARGAHPRRPRCGQPRLPGWSAGRVTGLRRNRAGRSGHCRRAVARAGTAIRRPSSAGTPTRTGSRAARANSSPRLTPAGKEMNSNVIPEQSYTRAWQPGW
jgi:hypothetical protein